MATRKSALTLPLRLLFALAAVPYLGLAFLPVHLLVGISVADDAFYYQTIARNIAAGLGSTFDGVNPTDGYHPLFMALQVVLWKLAPAPLGTVPLRFGLVLLGLASLATGWLTFDLVRRRLGIAAATATGLLWLANPFVLLTTHAGVEAPLATCALAASVWWWNLRCSDEAKTLRPWLILGLLLGLAGLARTDSVLFGGALLCFAWFRQVRRHGWRQAARSLGAAAALALALTLPWLFWCWFGFGHPLPDSGRAISKLAWQAAPPATDAVASLRFLGASLGAIARHIARLAGGAGMLAVLGVAAAALLALRRWHLTTRSEVPLVTPFLLGGATVFLFYGLVFCFTQPWYLLTVWLSLTVVGGWVQAQILHLRAAALRAGARLPRALHVVFPLALPVLILSVYLPTALYELRTGVYPWQQTYLELSHRLRVRMPGRLGSFNAGIYGFFCGSPVVNLDGVVNGRAYQAARAGRLLSYIRDEARLDYVLDHVATLRSHARSAGPELRQALVPIASFPNASDGGPIVLWKVQPRNQAQGGAQPNR